MTNIYDKINDVDFDTDVLELNDIERAKMIKTAKNYSKKDNKKKFVASAAAILLFTGLMAPPVRAEVAKFTTDIKVSMMEAIGASPDSYKYVTELNEPVKVGNDSFVIGNIAFEDNKVFINTLREGDGSIDSMLSENEASIYKIVVDGESYKSEGQSGQAGYLSDGKTISEVAMINFDKEFPAHDNTDVDLYFTDGTGSEIVSIKTSTNTVNEENIIFAKDQVLENGIEISLIKLNPITMTAVINNLDMGYDYQVIGVNRDGNTFTLDARTGKDDEVTFIYNNEFSDMTLDQIKETDEINFILKGRKMNQESGLGSNEEYEKLAEYTYKK